MAGKIFRWITKGKRPYIIIFSIAGAAGGYLYWRFVGCKTGTCPIKSVWYYSSLYGLVLGYLAGDLVSGFISKRRSSRSADN